MSYHTRGFCSVPIQVCFSIARQACLLYIAGLLSPISGINSAQLMHSVAQNVANRAAFNAL